MSKNIIFETFFEKVNRKSPQIFGNRFFLRSHRALAYRFGLIARSLEKKATGTKIGILINFGNIKKLEWKKLVYTNDRYIKNKNVVQD